MNEVASFMAIIRGIIESFSRACPQIGSFFISFFVALVSLSAIRYVGYRHDK